MRLYVKPSMIGFCLDCTLEIGLVEIHRLGVPPEALVPHLGDKVSTSLRRLADVAERLEMLEGLDQLQAMGIDAEPAEPAIIDAEIVPPDPFKHILIHKGNTENIILTDGKTAVILAKEQRHDSPKDRPSE
jgi:hypothetical protein